MAQKYNTRTLYIRDLDQYNRVLKKLREDGDSMSNLFQTFLELYEHDKAFTHCVRCDKVGEAAQRIRDEAENIFRTVDMPLKRG